MTVPRPATGAAADAGTASGPSADWQRRFWSMTPDQRVAAFYRGEMNLRDCLAWARRYPHEPPLAADGEYLFIAVKTPEWADEVSSRQLSRVRSL